MSEPGTARKRRRKAWIVPARRGTQQAMVKGILVALLVLAPAVCRADFDDHFDHHHFGSHDSSSPEAECLRWSDDADGGQDAGVDAGRGDELSDATLDAGPADAGTGPRVCLVRASPFGCSAAPGSVLWPLLAAAACWARRGRRAPAAARWR